MICSQACTWFQDDASTLSMTSDTLLVSSIRWAFRSPNSLRVQAPETAGGQEQNADDKSDHDRRKLCDRPLPPMCFCGFSISHRQYQPPYHGQCPFHAPYFQVCHSLCHVRRYFSSRRDTALISMGFAICPFIPCSRQRWISSKKASAVMAMMGMPASGRFNARMASVA